MQLQIREATPGDFDQVFELLKQLWAGRELDYAGMQKMFDHNLQSSYQFYIVAADGAQVTGFCSLTVKYNLWQQGLLGNVDEMIVDEKCRGRGIGKKLMTRNGNCPGK